MHSEMLREREFGVDVEITQDEHRAGVETQELVGSWNPRLPRTKANSLRGQRGGAFFYFFKKRRW